MYLCKLSLKPFDFPAKFIGLLFHLRLFPLKLETIPGSGTRLLIPRPRFAFFASNHLPCLRNNGLQCRKTMSNFLFLLLILIEFAPKGALCRIRSFLHGFFPKSGKLAPVLFLFSLGFAKFLAQSRFLNFKRFYISLDFKNLGVFA